MPCTLRRGRSQTGRPSAFPAISSIAISSAAAALLMIGECMNSLRRMSCQSFLGREARAAMA